MKNRKTLFMKKTVAAVLLTLLTVTFMGTGIHASEQTALDTIISIDTYESEAETLTLGALEMRVNKDHSGSLAVIYDKAFDESRILTDINVFYLKEQDSVVAGLVDDYEDILKDLTKKRDQLSFEPINVRAAIDHLEALVTTLKSEPLSTIDMEIQQASALSAELSEAFLKDFSGLKGQDYEKSIEIERIRNIDLQKIIDGLGEKRLSYEEKARTAIEEKTMDGLYDVYKSALSTYSLGLNKVKSNDNEVFVLLDFKDLQDVDTGFVMAQVGSVRGLQGYEHESVPGVSNDSVGFFTQIDHLEALYIKNGQEPAEIKAARDLVEEIKTQVKQIETIVLETEGIRIVDEQLSAINELTKSVDSESVSARVSAIRNEIQKTIDLMEAYRSYEGKVADDSQGIDKTLELLVAWEDEVAKCKDEALPVDALKDQFNDYELLGLYKADGLPVGLRLTLEGNFVLYKMPNGTVATSDNYFLNMANSGDSAMRFLDGETTYLAIFEPDAISLKTVSMALVGYLLLLVVLFFVKRDWFKNLMVANTLLILCAIVIYPLIWVVGASFNESSSLGSVGINPFPEKFSTLQYQRLLLTTDYKLWFLNTLKIAVSNMTITVSLAVSAAYVFSRFKFKGKKMGMMTMLIIQIFPTFSALVAIYTLLANVRFLEFLTGESSLVNTHLGLILVYTAGQIPYNTWLIKGYFDTLPRSMDEAAKIDGASNMQAFLKVILPLGRPIIAFVAVTAFMAPWMDFILPRLLLKSTEKKTLAVGLFEMINGNSNNNFTMFAAGAVLVALPITLMYAYFQKYIVSGLASGAVKG